ncbi:MAG TPA: hypothetical protein VJ816_01230 [Gemmatimonadales bacterium]|nr:hypothetical protein [Gemmatimonadales bacterium]
MRPAATLLLCAVLTTCTNELAPTGAVTLSLAKAAVWPDTLAVAEIASVAISATDPDQQVVAAVTLEWGSTDSTVVTVTNAATPLNAIVTSRRPGSATIIVKVAQSGFEPVELRSNVVVRARGADSLLTVTDTVTVGITHGPGLLDGATVTWGSSDPAVVNVSTVPGDSTQAVLIARSSGSAQVTASVQSSLGHSEFQLPVVVRPLELVENPSGSWPASINLSNSATVAVQVLDARGQIKTGRRVTWRSTNEAAFSVDSTGIVLAKTKGGGELVASVGAPPFEVAEHRANLQVKEKWRAVSTGGVHTCAIAALDGSGYCWGSNLQGQLGVGFDNLTLPQTQEPRRIATSHRFTEIGAGAEHSCGRENFQTLLCWGSRSRGALGDGACIGGFGTNCFTAAESPVEIVSGGNLGGAQLHLDQLVVGGTFTCIVTTTGGSGSFASRDVRCWGTADENGRGIALADSAAVAPVLQPGLSGNAQITEVTAGGAHLCTKTDDIWWVRCQGINDHAQLGDGTVGNEPGPPWLPKDFTIVGGDPAFPGGDGYPASTVTAGGSHTCALDAIGVLCWGSNASGQLGSAVAGDAVYPTRATLGVAVVALTAGADHTCGLTASGEAWCWGSNSNGQLGRGTIGGSSSAAALVTGGLTFVSISANGAHTCGVTTDGSIYCWGANLFGQLGDGTTSDRGAPARVVESPQ